MKLNRTWTMVVAIVMALTLSLSGTLAYLQDTDEDVNVMTLGNVQIEQIELERIEASESEAENKDNFQSFTQGQTLYPAVGTDDDENIPYATDEKGDKVHQQLPYGGAIQLWDDDGKNVMDKLVFVKNTGKSDAYVRTIIAFEGTSVGGGKDSLVHFAYNGTFWTENLIGVITVNGVEYSLYEFVYTRDGGAGVGVLKAGETTRPSLLQLYMSSWGTNEDMAQFGDTYDILVVSQAVQAAGFADAETALNEAFGEVSAESHPWMDGEDGDQEPDTLAATADELKAALASTKDASVTLTNDIAIDTLDVTGGTNDVVINGNGNTITITDARGLQIQGANRQITMTNATVQLSAQHQYPGDVRGVAINNDNYNGTTTVNLINCEIELDDVDWAYGINLPAGVNGVNLNIDGCTITGAIAVNVWGDKNTISIKNSKLVSNYNCDLGFTASIVRFNNDGSNVAENNTVSIENCEFDFIGANTNSRSVYGVYDGGTANSITVSNCTYSDTVTHPKN